MFTDTENLLKELSAFHKKNIEDFSEHISLNADFEKQQAELKREKKKFEVENKFSKMICRMSLKPSILSS